jgi:hypothetical protein
VSHSVEFSPEALADLLDLYDYIALRDGAERAIGYIGRIEVLPQPGGVRPELVDRVQSSLMAEVPPNVVADRLQSPVVFLKENKSVVPRTLGLSIKPRYIQLEIGVVPDQPQSLGELTKRAYGTPHEIVSPVPADPFRGMSVFLLEIQRVECRNGCAQRCRRSPRANLHRAPTAAQSSR